MVEQLRLWTPTDWKAETALRVEYINWLINNNGLPCMRTKAGPYSAEGILKAFREQGVLYYSSEESALVLSFEEWRELWDGLGVSQMKVESTYGQLQNVMRKFL
jgi:hypothetical protein